MLSTILSLVCLGLAGGAIALPTWLMFPAQTQLAWNYRNVGLLKLSGQFTNVMSIPADLTWGVVKDGVCAVATGQAGLMTGSLTGMATAMAMSKAGASCKATCQANFFTRCKQYNIMKIMGFVAAGCMAGGGLIALVGSMMPYFGKEKSSDKLVNFFIILTGAIIACVGPALWWFMWNQTYEKILATSWYPKFSYSTGFFLGCGCGIAGILASVFQLIKVLKDDSGKSKEKDAAGAAAELDPTLIDPTLL